MNINELETHLKKAPRVVPVVTFTAINQVEPLVQCFFNHKIEVIEVTLRTSVGLEALKLIKNKYPNMLTGAGTVKNKASFIEAEATGCDFMVSPGASESLLAQAAKSNIPLIPGVMTPSEIQQAIESGYQLVKLFPASVAGGPAYLKSMQAVYPEVSFFPTGGINIENKNEYLAGQNVTCVGGTWLTPVDLLEAGNWNEIEHLLAALN